MTLLKMLDRAAAARLALDSAIDRLGVSSPSGMSNPVDNVGVVDALDLLVYRDILHAIDELNALEATAPPSFVDGSVLVGPTARDKPT